MGDKSGSTTIMPVGGMTGTGGAIGTAVGPIGTAVGAGVGALADLGMWFVQNDANKKAQAEAKELAMLQFNEGKRQHNQNYALNKAHLGLARDRFGWDQRVTERNQDRTDRLDSYSMRQDQRNALTQAMDRNAAFKQMVLNVYNNRAQAAQSRGWGR